MEATAQRRKQLLQILKEEGEGEGEGQAGDIAITDNQDKGAKSKGKKTGAGAGGWRKQVQVNPLKLVPAEYRHLIITLHVLFPGVVLPGLEVLERGLVERITLRSAVGEPVVKKETKGKKEEKGEEEKEDEDVTMGEHDDDGHNNHDEEGYAKAEQKAKENKSAPHVSKGEEKRRQRQPEIYLVRSSQFLNTYPKRGKRKSNMGNMGNMGLGRVDIEASNEADQNQIQIQIQRYLVSLEAWNCTCAAFAFACVSELELEPEPETELPPGERRVGEPGESKPEAGAGAGAGAGEEGKEERGGSERQRKRDEPGPAGWTFGGMTLFDAQDHSSVPPVCKHLLACLLADKWRGALGRYVTERVVGREEMAGVVADV